MSEARPAQPRDHRVLTVTLNPALDFSTSTPSVVPAHKLRCTEPLRHPGGGGINVARVLHRLGEPVLALYLAGGLIGEQLHVLMAQEGVAGERLAITGETRSSFAVVESGSGREYRFVLPGPTVLAAEWAAAIAAVGALSPSGGLVVLSGSLPPGLPDDAYAQLAGVATSRGSRVVLDSSGPPLATALAAKCIALVKPSLRELGELMGRKLDTEAQWKTASQALIAAAQAERVALSLGEQGAMLTTAQGCWRADALSVPVASTTGAGDSFLAALCSAWLRGQPEPEMLRWAVAAGSAALLEPGTALCRPEEVARLAPQVRIRPV